MLGNINDISPNELSQLDNCTQNIQQALTSHTASIVVLNQKTTNITYESIKTTTVISGNTAFLNTSVNESLVVGGTLLVGQNMLISGDIIISGKIITNDMFKKHNVGFLYVSNMSLPVIKSIPNTKIAFTNLNIKTLLGTTGNSANVSIYPYYKIQFVFGSIILCSIDNTSGNDMLFSTVIFTTIQNCTSINCYYRGNLV